MKLPDQRWRIAPCSTEKVNQLVKITRLSPLLAQVILNRGIDTPDAQIYLNPESQQLPSPLDEFTDLAISVKRLTSAIVLGEKIAICGDYDADGMTSTALLLRSLKHLGARVDYAIPSRMKDGYGINGRIVKEFAEDGVKLILTVDNGIAAYEPIQLAVELGISVIVTDHHDLPEKLPPADAILNPKQLSVTSPYRGLAGVGVAYILAVTTAQSLGLLKGLTEPLLELFTLGTIADLAPLVGVNRRWLKRGLKRLPQSKLAGIQALMQMAGVSDTAKQLHPDDIGFRLGPRINAIGRIGDPQTVIELLTTDDLGIALERAMQCEQINKERQFLCEKIEKEAIHLIESTPIEWRSDRILLVVAADWHHGVIGIVASRLVERYGVPVFIGTYEEDAAKIRGSARGIEEFNVFEALEFCKDLLGKHGGHKAAGGFSLAASDLAAFRQRLRQFAHQCLQTEHLKPLVKIDAQADFAQLTLELYQQIEQLQPWGIGNEFPLFWTPNVQIVEQKLVKNQHLKLKLVQKTGEEPISAIAWRWGCFFPLPRRLDLAYKLRENQWNGTLNLELEVVGVRLSAVESATKKAIFVCGTRTYTCSFWATDNEVRIKNEQGQVLVAKLGQNIGLLGEKRETAQIIDLKQAHFSQLMQMAVRVLELD